MNITMHESRFREELRPDGTMRSFCHFCGLEVPEDEVHEWGMWASTPPVEGMPGGMGVIVRAHRRCREEGLEWRGDVPVHKTVGDEP